MDLHDIPGEPARIEPGPDHVEEDMADHLDNVVPGYGYDLLPMVGVGGSAGAVPALRTFFEAIAPDTGMVFVVVLHLAADHESSLAEIIGRATSMPVAQVHGTVKVEANHIYVVPPGKAIESVDGHLTAVDLTPDHGRRVAVDLFFRTLADSHGPRCSAVVLSGADGDGAIGVKRIKERGGLTIAQDPDEAEFEGMPRSAIATGMVDWVLRLADMPGQLVRYHALLPRLRLPPEKGVSLQVAVPRDEDDLEATLREVLVYLRTQTGRDFTSYKRATVLRRLGRRMSVNGIEDLPGYLAFLRTNPGESGALLQDLLISVSNFFRDRDAFDALATHIPALFADKAANDDLRVWVVGCASGEEAYSIAMLLFEHARLLDAPPSIQVFATDLAEDAVRVGRDAVYPPAIAADVSPARLRRFFTKDHRGYRVCSELREAVLFAVHDVLHDPPFSRLDLVSCRNLLIYFDREAQARAFETLHFGLRPGGRLFLGAAETTEPRGDLFAAVDKRHRLYEPRPVARQLPLAAAQSALALSLDFAARQPDRMAPSIGPAGAARFGAASRLRPKPGDVGVSSWRELHLKLIERLAPPSVLVDQAHTIIHLSESAGRFLHFSGGEPSTDLATAVHPALSTDLRTALLRIRETGVEVVTRPLPFVYDGAPVMVVVRVVTAHDIAPDFLLVSFERSPRDGAVPIAPKADADDEVGRRLERRVDELKWHLRDVSERSETTEQELKANNEELQAMNEELRSASEELETSREELQSINEELTTVNQELKSNVDDLGRSNQDLQNLMHSTAIATVFLDRGLRITLFTPPAVALFNLIASDVGRPLSDLAHQLDYPQMSDDARKVLDALVPVEREITANAGFFLARCLPYRSAEDRIAGVVFTFLDITVRKQAEDALRESEAQFRTIVNQALAGVAHLDLTGRLTLVNARFCDIVGRSEGELLGSLVFDLVHPDDRRRNLDAFERMTHGGEPFEMEKRYVRRDGGIVWVNAAVTVTHDAEDRPTAAVAILIDITARRQAELSLRGSEDRLRLVLENAREYAILAMDTQRRITSWNNGAEGILGYREDEILGHLGDEIFVEEDRLAGLPEREAGVAEREGRAADERWHRRKDGSRFWGSGVMMTMRDAEGQFVGYLKIFRDQTAVRAAHEALELSRSELVQALVENRRARGEAEAASQAKDRFLAILSHELRTPLTPVVMALHALERSADLTPATRGTLDLIRRNVKAELHLIDDLLDVTRISSGKMEMSSGVVDMHQVIRAALDVCEADLAAKRQRLRLELRARACQVPGDGSRLQQVVWNLLKNASKFTPVEGDIFIATDNADSGRFVFVVADTGVGIEESKLETIFDAFAQEGPWVTTEFGGLGLGLAIAKATVDAHHGTLAAESGGRNRGAAFTVELPVELPAERVSP